MTEHPRSPDSAPLPFRQVGQVRAIPVSLLLCAIILYVGWLICPPYDNGHGALALDAVLMLCALNICSAPIKIGRQGKIPWFSREWLAYASARAEERAKQRAEERAMAKYPGREIGRGWATLVNFVLFALTTAIFTLLGFVGWSLLSFAPIGSFGGLGVGQLVALLIGARIWFDIFGQLVKYSSRGRIPWRGTSS